MHLDDLRAPARTLTQFSKNKMHNSTLWTCKYKFYKLVAVKGFPNYQSIKAKTEIYFRCNFCGVGTRYNAGNLSRTKLWYITTYIKFYFIRVIRGLIPNLIDKTNLLNVHLCDVRFLGCSSCLTLIKCAALRWTNRRIIDGAIRNNWAGTAQREGLGGL